MVQIIASVVLGHGSLILRMSHIQTRNAAFGRWSIKNHDTQCFFASQNAGAIIRLLAHFTSRKRSTTHHG
jgi:hypothetical protein